MSVKRKQRPIRRRIVKKPKNPKTLKKLAVALAIVLVATVAYAHFLQPHTLEAKQVLKLQSTEQQLNKTLNQLKTTKTDSLDEQKQKDTQILQLQEKIQQQQSQLQARAARKTATAYAAALPTYSLPTNAAKAYIYDHESGNNPGSINASSGACGLGQALPCSKLPCSLTNYACQDAFFTRYALERYGSWSNAAAFWRSHRWW